MEEEKTTPNYVQLMKTVVEFSKSTLMDIARAEWYITGHYKEEDGVTCLCGHEHCKYVYVIKNYYNNNLLAPIGSECMHYFEWNEQEAKILEAFEKWHFKKYRNPGFIYDQVEFHEVIKDAEYVRSLDKYGKTKEHERLIAYARAVWIHNPPPPPPQPITLSLPPPMSVCPSPPCQKCVEQMRKGYKKCYECFTKQAPKPTCEKCVEQRKKGYPRCFGCNEKKKKTKDEGVSGDDNWG